MQDYFDQLKWKSSEIVEWIQESLDIYIDEQLLLEDDEFSTPHRVDQIVEDILREEYKVSDENVRKEVLEKIKERLKYAVINNGCS